MSYKVAVTTSDQQNINLHFGAAEAFYIYELSEGEEAQFTERRDIPQEWLEAYRQEMKSKGCCGKNEGYIYSIAALLEDCKYLLTEKIGPRPYKAVLAKGISCLEISCPVEEALQKISAYEKRMTRHTAENKKDQEAAHFACVEKLLHNHPCFGGEAKGNTGRIHLPVSPGCNIECQFCNRKINDYEKRPGVASAVITPDEALEAVGRALKLCNNIKVVGIAGPGDTLATPYALETFRKIKDKYPELIRCMSTNGLLLKERAEEIAEVGIDSLTVTVNAVAPEIEEKLNEGIHYHGVYYKGRQAAEILIENQLEGIRKVTDMGIVVKVNTVLVPEINEEHIEEIAKTVKEAGAYLYNIIPLIPQHNLSHCKEPDCAEIDAARQRAEKYIQVFRHCQRCRADAVGIPGGEDFGSQIYLKRLSPEETFSHG